MKRFLKGFLMVAGGIVYMGGLMALASIGTKEGHIDDTVDDDDLDYWYDDYEDELI